MLRVNVTNHALHRYRQRVAVYADAPESELVEAVRRATPLGDGDPTPFPKTGGTRYYRSAESPDVYFVAEPVARDYVNLVTVLDCSRRAVPPPKERQVVNRGPGGATPRKDVPRFPVPDDPEPAADAPVRERRDYWRGVWYDAAFMCGMLNRAHPDSPAWRALATRAGRELGDLRDEYQAWKAAQADGDQIYRDDGGVNFGPAIKFLLAEVQSLRGEVAALKAARTTAA
jgi:hypothetical protein